MADNTPKEWASVTAPLASVSSADYSGLIAILMAFSLSLVLLSVGVRLYVRRAWRSYRPDDFAFFGAVVCSFIQTSLVGAQLKHGLGQSITIRVDGDVRLQGHLSIASTTLYLATLFLSKTSASFLFLTLTPQRIQRRVIYSAFVLTPIWVITSVALEIFRCDPSRILQELVETCDIKSWVWSYVTGVDVCIELFLVATSVMIVWSLQMSLSRKTAVVGAFACRLPNIACSIAHIYFIHQNALVDISDKDTRHIWSTRVVSTMQLSIGYTITASVIPYLRPFMMAYDRPSISYSQSRYLNNRTPRLTTKFKLSSLTSKSSNANAKLEAGLATMPPNKPKSAKTMLGALRPDRTAYEANAGRTIEARSEHGSDDSHAMIITKDVEWSVEYEGGDRSMSISREPDVACSAQNDPTIEGV